MWAGHGSIVGAEREGVRDSERSRTERKSLSEAKTLRLREGGVFIMEFLVPKMSWVQ